MDRGEYIKQMSILFDQKIAAVTNDRDYWKERCEAAENVLVNDFEPFMLFENSRYLNWQQLKTQQHGTDNV